MMGQTGIAPFAGKTTSRPTWKRGDYFKSPSREPAILLAFWRRGETRRWM